MIDIETPVLRFLRDNFFADEEVNSLSRTDSLTESGIVDSTGMLELVLFLQRHFNIEIPDEDVIPDHFDTLQSIVTYLNGRITPASRHTDKPEA